MNLIESNKLDRKSTGVIFLDIEKAFDYIWHDGLVFKLSNFGFPIYLQKVIYSFLANRTFIVYIDSNFSTERVIPSGLPQGSVLSPTLYSIYTSDISIKNNFDAGFYADDSAFICCGKVYNAIIKRMQNAFADSSKIL